MAMAGDVFYNVTKFNQKNRENLTADLKELMSSSTNDLVIDVSMVHYCFDFSGTMKVGIPAHIMCSGSLHEFERLDGRDAHRDETA